MPKVEKYTYLGVDFAYNGSWDAHVKKVLDSGKKKVNQLHSVISNRSINLTARRLLLLSVVRPCLEYGSEVWECNKTQASALESVLLGGAKKVLGCSSKTCNEAGRGDMGLEELQGRRDKTKLKWWYKLVSMPEDRYPRKVFDNDWDIKPRRGRQRKMWSRIVEELLMALELDREEWLERIKNSDCTKKEFLCLVSESIRDRDCKKFEEGLNKKVKLQLYKRFGNRVEFKKYLHGECDAGTRLLFKFRSGTHGLNEELGRHSNRDGRKECMLCGAECESVCHVLWECSAYDSIRSNFIESLKDTLGDRYLEFESLDIMEKTAFVLGTELWGDEFKVLLDLVKDFIVAIWESRKLSLYDNNVQTAQSQSSSHCSTGDRGNSDRVSGLNGKLGKLKCHGGKTDTTVPLSLYLNSAHSRGCVANGSNAMV